MNKRKCSNCGFKNVEEAKFCKKCGTKLGVTEKQEEKKKESADEEMVLCPHCHTKNKKKAKFCEECGKALEEKKEIEEEVVEKQELAEGLCPSCGYKNKETAKFCKKCGTKLGVVEVVITGESKEEEMVLCPHCQAKNKKGAKFCEECGKTLEEKEERKEVKEQPEKVQEKESTIGLCPSCGYKNKENAKFCKKCGTKLGIETVPEDQMMQEDNNQEVQAVIEEKKQEDEAEKVLCPQCHAKNKKGSKFCEECGQTLEEKEPTEEVKEQPEKVPEKESTIGLCPSCGFKNKENAKFCKKCGTKLKVENSQEDQAVKQEDKSQKVEEAKQEVLKEEKNDKSTKNELKEQKLAAKREKNKKKSKKKLIIIICILLIVFIAIGTMFHFGLFDNIVSKKENATKEEIEEKNKDGWSSWSQELPKNVTEEDYQIEQKTQYSKRTKKTKTSTSKTLEGWTLYDTKESGEEKTKEVETAKKIKEFEANKKIKIINKETITEKYEAVLCGYYNPKDGQNRFYTPNDKKPYCDEEDSYTLKEDKGEYPAGTYKVGDNFNKSYTNSNGEKIFYKVVKINPYKIKYTYKDSDDKTTYYFYKWSSWSKYQDEEITEDDTTEVKTRTVYRYKEKESN